MDTNEFSLGSFRLDLGGSPDLSALDLTTQADEKLWTVNTDTNSNFLNIIEDNGPVAMMTFTRSYNDPEFVTINGSKGMLVEINTLTGEHKFGEFFTPSEAAEVFWTALGTMHSNAIVELKRAQETLDEVSLSLVVRNGELIADVADKRMEEIDILRRKVDQLTFELRQLKGEPVSGWIDENHGFFHMDDVKFFVTSEPVNIPAVDASKTIDASRIINLTRTLNPKNVRNKNFDDAMNTLKDF